MLEERGEQKVRGVAGAGGAGGAGDALLRHELDDEVTS